AAGRRCPRCAPGGGPGLRVAPLRRGVRVAGSGVDDGVVEIVDGRADPGGAREAPPGVEKEGVCTGGGPDHGDLPRYPAAGGARWPGSEDPRAPIRRGAARPGRRGTSDADPGCSREPQAVGTGGRGAGGPIDRGVGDRQDIVATGGAGGRPGKRPGGSSEVGRGERGAAGVAVRTPDDDGAGEGEPRGRPPEASPDP